MNLQLSYEQFYQNESDRSIFDLAQEVKSTSRGIFQFAVESKNKFLPDVDWSSLRILEVGAGRGGVGLLLAGLGARVTLMDFSPSALKQAKAIFESEGYEVETVVGDVTFPDTEFSHKFDLIVDSHLLHCLTDSPQRTSYYRLVNDYLTERGVFVAETMAHRKKLFVPEIPDGFMFDEKNVLWQMLGGSWTPVRKILDSLDLEDELKAAHFEIIYFYYYGQYGFVPHKSFLDLPSEVLPAAVRFVVRKVRDTF